LRQLFRLLVFGCALATAATAAAQTKFVGRCSRGKPATCTAKFDATGAAVFDVVGEYSIAAAKTK
jgi:hypothetical protein